MKDQMEARKRVWQQFSRLFVNLELEEGQIREIAEELTNSPFSLGELKHIANQEVAPACGANLLEMEGGCQDFKTEWLEARCSRFQSANRYTGQLTAVNSSFWQQIAKLMKTQLPTPEYAAMVRGDLDKILSEISRQRKLNHLKKEPA